MPYEIYSKIRESSEISAHIHIYAKVKTKIQSLKSEYFMDHLYANIPQKTESPLSSLLSERKNSNNLLMALICMIKESNYLHR